MILIRIALHKYVEEKCKNLQRWKLRKRYFCFNKLWHPLWKRSGELYWMCTCSVLETEVCVCVCVCMHVQTHTSDDAYIHIAQVYICGDLCIHIYLYRYIQFYWTSQMLCFLSFFFFFFLQNEGLWQLCV